MAGWRSLELEQLFGGALDETGITKESIERLVSEKVGESEQLEFKADFSVPTKTSWNEAQEFAKDVSAMANHRGGIILYGIRDTKGKAQKLDPLPSTGDAEKQGRKLRQGLVNYQAPLAHCDFVWVSDGDGGRFLAVIVPPSPRSPHAVLGSLEGRQQSFGYPLRHGADTVWLSEAEVAERYRRRFSVQQNAQTLINQVIQQGFDALGRSSGLWLFAAIVPENPILGRLDRATVQRIEDWHRENRLLSPLNRLLPAFGRGIPAPGRVTFTGSMTSSQDDESAINDAYVELHVDGCAFAATPISQRTDEEGDGSEVGERTLADDSVLIVDLITRWAASQAGGWGTGSIEAGFVDATSDEGLVERPAVFVDYEGSRIHKVRGTREVKGRVRVEAAADLAAVDTVQQRLAITYQVLAGLLQWFGWAEPLALRADGSIDATESLIRDHNDIVAWAQEKGVELKRLKRR